MKQHYDNSNADLNVYARRQSGTALGRMGHDLKFAVDAFDIDLDLDAGTMSARVDAASVVPVDSIIWESREETGELSDGDRREIKQRMSADIFELDEFPAIEFSADSLEETDEGWHVEGTIEMHGERAPVSFDAIRVGDRVRAEGTLDHTEVGIEPYSAMLGSLKVDPEVVVEFEGPNPTIT